MKIKTDKWQYRTCEEHLEILNQLGNNFLTKNPSEKQKALTYIQQYGFFSFVDPFMLLLRDNLKDALKDWTSKFLAGFQLNDLVQLFKFDQALKSRIWNVLSVIWEKLKRGIVYYTLQAIATVCNDLNDIPFYLIDNNRAPIIGKVVFNNNFSMQSFCNEDNEFDYDNYYSFLAKYVDIFDICPCYIDNEKIEQFYNYHIVTRKDKILLINAFKQYLKMNKYQNNKQEELAPSKDVTNKAIYTNFSKFFK